MPDGRLRAWSNRREARPKLQTYTRRRLLVTLQRFDYTAPNSARRDESNCVKTSTEEAGMRNNPVAKVCPARPFRLAPLTIFLIVALLMSEPLIGSRAQSSGLQSEDLYRLRSVGGAHFSPAAARVSSAAT